MTANAYLARGYDSRQLTLRIYFLNNDCFLVLVLPLRQQRRSWPASPSKFFRQFWAKFSPILANLSKIWSNLDKIWGNLDKFGKICVKCDWV